jgi:Holliday junction DNA helicase RuvA
MIARIQGTLVYKTASYTIIDAHGLGYRVFVPLTTFYELPEIGQDVALNIHTHVKEDAIHLFGFYTAEERDIFQLMISVTGIGPKLAVSIMSGIAARELVKAVSAGDLSRLVNIPGVGKKTAERLILELRDKVKKLGDGEAEVRGEKAAVTDRSRIFDDALSALINLGYKEQMVKKVLDRIDEESQEEIPTLDLLLKNALKVIAG